jgi:hypothetical protein
LAIRCCCSRSKFQRGQPGRQQGDFPPEGLQGIRGVLWGRWGAWRRGLGLLRLAGVLEQLGQRGAGHAPLGSFGVGDERREVGAAADLVDQG